MAAPIQSRLRLHQDWIADLPLKFLWTIDFFSRTGNSMASVGNNIRKIVNDYQPNSWTVDPNLFDRFTDTGGNIGYLLASSVALPNEQFELGASPMVNSGGFVGGYYSGRRADYAGQNKLDVTLLETNKDIIDNFIKPWIIAASYKGLVEDGENDIKCNISLTLHTKPGFKARKTFVFRDCVPFMTTGDQMSYNEMDAGELNKTVSFAFSYYTIKDRSGNGA